MPNPNAFTPRLFTPRMHPTHTPHADIAMHTGAKRFLSQRHCASLTNLWWRGGSKSSTVILEPVAGTGRWLLLILQVVFPFLHPDIRQGRRRKHGAADKTDIGKGNLFEAVARFLKTARVELQESQEGLHTSGIARSDKLARSFGGLGRASLSRLQSVVGMQDDGVQDVALMSPLAYATGLELVDPRRSLLLTRLSLALDSSFYAIPAVRFLQVCQAGLEPQTSRPQTYLLLSRLNLALNSVHCCT